MTRIAVVILNYNGENYLKQFLPTVIRCSQEAEVYVADNASTDNSIEVLKKYFPDVHLIELSKNHGFAGGYNEALKHIKSDYYVLLNSDVEVTENWLVPMKDFLDCDQNYAACQPKIKDYHHKSRFEYAGAAGGFVDSLGYPYCRGRIFETLEDDTGQYDEASDIFWSSGACMMIRSEVFFDVGGFDHDFFAHMEEIDLCWRINSHGLKIKCIPSSVVYHVGGGTLSKSSPFKTYLNFRNGLFLLLKNLPSVKLLLKLPVRIILDWVAAVKFLIEGNARHSLAIIRAHFSALAQTRKMMMKRSKTSNSPGSEVVIIDYYLRDKSKYSDL